MRVFALILSFLLLALSAQAQLVPPDREHYLDSMNTLMRQHTTDSAKATYCFDLSNFWSNKDTAKASAYLRQGLSLSGKSLLLRGTYYYYAGLFYQETRESDKAEAVLQQCENLLKQLSTKAAYQVRAMAMYDYGILQQMKDDQKTFVDLLTNKVIPFARLGGDSVYVGMSYLALGTVFENTKQYDRAEANYTTALRLFRDNHAPPERLLMCYSSMVENYMLQGKPALAKMALDSAYSILKPYPESVYFVDYYAAEALYFTEMKQFAASMQSIDKGIALARKLDRPFEEQRLQVQKLSFYFNQNNFPKAREVLNYLLEQPYWNAYATNRLQSYDAMATAYASEGNMGKAYEWQKKYSTLSDSFYQGRLQNDIAAMEIKYQSAEKQKKIAVLEGEKQKAALVAKNHRQITWLLGIVSLLLLAAIILLTIYYRGKKKLAEQKEINSRQQLKELEQQQQLKFTQAMLEGEERERQRVARDLHDGLGGMLAGIKINLSRHSGQEQSSGLDPVIERLDQSLTELRRIARNMMPESLLKFGLEAALRDLCDSLMSEKTRITFQAYDIEKDMPAATQANIYRIVQEALSNAIRHASASDIVVQCSQNEDVFLITVEDNGKGFDPVDNEKTNGIGLSNIRNRVAYLNGKLDIASTLNEGTVINIELHLGA